MLIFIRQLSFLADVTSKFRPCPDDSEYVRDSILLGGSFLDRMNLLYKRFEMLRPVRRDGLVRPPRLLTQIALRERLVLSEVLTQEFKRLPLAFRLVLLIGHFPTRSSALP